MTEQKAPNEEQKSKEKKWTKKICKKLNESLESHGLHVDTFQKIPYSHVIDGYSNEKTSSKNWTPISYMNPECFETDLVIYELKNGIKKPRVIVEVKYESITTHDAITYSCKAEKHKNITPYLRYGIMIGASDNKGLPSRLFHHGTNFDFMFSFVNEEPSPIEWDTYLDMILKEVEYSKTIEGILKDKGKKKNKTKYYMLQKQLVLTKISDDEKQI